MNTTIFGFNFLDKYKHEYVKVYQSWANMNTNMIILTDIDEYEYKNKCIIHKGNKIYMYMDKKVFFKYAH